MQNKKTTKPQADTIDNTISLKSTDDNGKEIDITVEVIDETVFDGKVYLLVCEIEDASNENDDRECFILQDLSKEEDEEATYVVASEEEQKKVYEIFKKKLISEDIILE